jgi:YVTN family beta-propeller protein
MKGFLFILLLMVVACQHPNSTPGPWTATSPAGDQYTSNDPAHTVLPNGRLLAPLGKQIMVAPHPFGLALSPDGKTIITANSGVGPFSISMISGWDQDEPLVRQIPEGIKATDEELESTFMGVAISPDNQRVYVAGGQENKIYVFDVATKKKLGEISCNRSFDDRDYSDAYIGDLVLNKAGTRLYAIDQIGFRMVVIDTKTLQVIHNASTGRYPFGIALSPDGATAYVANIGMFEYSYLNSLDKKHLNETAERFPVSAYGSTEMREGVHNDSVDFEGLGDPNAPESFSVWSFDVTGTPMVKAKIKTGILVGQDDEGVPAVGGAMPNSIVASNKFVYVTNAGNDNIAVIDPVRQEVVEYIDLTLDPRLGNLKGIIPFGLALSPDQQRLFVAESGINAVAVIDVASRTVLGHLSTGWFPAKLAVTPDGKNIIVANAKGFGSGPNGGKNFTPAFDDPAASYIGVLMRGSVSVIPVPSDSEWPALTRQVVSNNFRFDQTASSSFLFNNKGQSPIQHIVFISKENRTYDEVFGQQLSGEGDSVLARFGVDRTFTNHAGQQRIERATVMPNHLALAGQFSISDNFYVDADVSADGHVWLTNTYPTQMSETGAPAAYGGKRSQKAESTAPGKFGITGAAGAIFPENYNQAGSLWEHLERNGIEFYNFGFGVEFDAGSFSDPSFKNGGVRYLVNYPMPGPLYNRTSRQFPTFNMAIPDQYRTDIFIREINERYIQAGKNFPSVLTLQLLNDHGAGERPEAGFPYNESYMADNDLALGRVVEYLSHLPQWKNMMIVVTEDDAQGGRDHIDAHRSILMVISPYAKKNFNSHRHMSFGSIFRTFYEALGLPPLNQYDFGSSNLGDCFTDKPDFAPYNALPVDVRIFDPVKALTPLHEKFDWEAARHSPELDDPDDIKKALREDGRKKVNH